MNLKGKILVTGIASNRSISFAIAKILQENGANVILPTKMRGSRIGLSSCFKS